MGILWTILIGFVIGVIARFIKPGDDSLGFVMTALVGIVGALVGGYLGRVTGVYAPNEPAGFFASLIGAVIVLFAVEMIVGKKRQV